MYEPPACELHEDWSNWSGRIAGEARRIGSLIRDALLTVFHSHGTGYGNKVTSKLVEFALTQRRLPFRIGPIVPAVFRGQRVDESPLDCLVINNCLLLVCTALFDSNQFNVSRGLSYLRALGLEWGIAANFGKRTLGLDGLHRAP